MYHSTALSVLQSHQNSNPITALLPNDSTSEAAHFSARSIFDILNVADELNLQAYFNNPFLDIPIFIAARTFIKEREEVFSGGYHHPFSNMPELDKCKEVLRKMAKFWGGSGLVHAILEQECNTRLRGQKQHSRDQSVDRQAFHQHRRRNSSTLATGMEGGDPRGSFSSAHSHRSSFDHHQPHHHPRPSHSERGIKAEPVSPSSYNPNWFPSLEASVPVKSHGSTQPPPQSQLSQPPTHLNNALGMSLKSAKAATGVGFALGFGSFGFATPTTEPAGNDGLGGGDFGVDTFGGWNSGMLPSPSDSANTGGYLGITSQW